MAMRAELYRRKRAVANRELTAAVLKKHGSRRSGERRRPKRLKPRGEQLPLTLKVER
jgi:hypothetical protein